MNYAEVAGDVVALIEGELLDLIEAFAERIATAILTRPLVEAVEVVVHKPAPAGPSLHRRAGASDASGRRPSSSRSGRTWGSPRRCSTTRRSRCSG